MYKNLSILIFFISFLCNENLYGQDTIQMETLRYDKRKTSNGWDEVNCYSGNFQFKMPGKVLEKTDSIETEIGRMPYYTFYFVDENDFGTVYLASYSEYPPHTIHSDSTAIISDFFEATIEASELSIYGKVIYSNDTNYKAYPGKVWRIDYKQGAGVVRSQAFLVKNRFYTFSVISDKKHLLNKQSEAFFDSFKIF